MLVIHPFDRTTQFLSRLYEGLDCKIINEYCSRSIVNHAIREAAGERIMLLGHGCRDGLLWRKDDTRPEFDKVIVGHQHAYNLRMHGSNLIMVSCYASDFAEKERLHGLFTDMFISEYQEALDNGVETTPEEIEEENQKFVCRMRQLLDEGCPLREIPSRLRGMDDTHSALTEFNYSRIRFM